MTDILQNMILFNNVPDSFLETCAKELQAIVPPPLQPAIHAHIMHAIASNNRVLRFFVLLTALAQSEAVRAQFVAGGHGDAQLRAWLDATIPSEWERFFLGADKHGQPMCTSVGDAKYGSMLDFVARMQAEYMALGWNEPEAQR